MTVKRPIMRYHGGKWRLAPQILPFFPPHDLYVEPFGGAGSLLMRKDPSPGEVYNDIDGDVVNVFRVLRDRDKAARLAELISLTPWSRQEFYLSYEPAPEGDDIERARRTLVRCYMAHGGTSRRRHRTGFRARMFRRNQTGPVDWVNYPNAISAFTDRLARVVIESREAFDIIRQHDCREALFYCDPPYLFSTALGDAARSAERARLREGTDRR